MKLIIGLGNIGQEYEDTRHNIGFACLDYFVDQKNCSEFVENKKFKSLISKNNLFSEDVLLVKPTTFMNLSGETVSALINFYKIDAPKDILVIYDDVDLKLGEIRFREKGSAGTHNGMRSIIAMLASENFPRLRLGIESRGETAPLKQELHSFVLSRFNKEESLIVKKVLAATNEMIEKFIKGEIPLAFSQSVL